MDQSARCSVLLLESDACAAFPAGCSGSRGEWHPALPQRDSWWRYRISGCRGWRGNYGIGHLIVVSIRPRSATGGSRSLVAATSSPWSWAATTNTWGRYGKCCPKNSVCKTGKCNNVSSHKPQCGSKKSCRKEGQKCRHGRCSDLAQLR